MVHQPGHIQLLLEKNHRHKQRYSDLLKVGINSSQLHSQLQAQSIFDFQTEEREPKVGVHYVCITKK